jgi:hypothetical protein
MRISDFAGIVSLLFIIGEAYTIQSVSDVRPFYRRNIILRCESSETQQNVRRNFLDQAFMVGVAYVVGVQPTLAAGLTNADNGMPTTKNKKLGGLAHKIQAVGHVLVR